MNDVANMPTRNCGKYIMAQHPFFRRFRRLSNRLLNSPPLHLRSGGPPIAPRLPGAMDDPGISDNAIAVPNPAGPLRDTYANGARPDCRLTLSVANMPPWSEGTKVARFLTGLLAAMLVASAGRCWSNDANKQISEDALRTDQRRDVFRHSEPGMPAWTALRAKPNRERFQKAFRGNAAAVDRGWVHHRAKRDREQRTVDSFRDGI